MNDQFFKYLNKQFPDDEIEEEFEMYRYRTYYTPAQILGIRYKRPLREGKGGYAISGTLFIFNPHKKNTFARFMPVVDELIDEEGEMPMDDEAHEIKENLEKCAEEFYKLQ